MFFNKVQQSLPPVKITDTTDMIVSDEVLVLDDEGDASTAFYSFDHHAWISTHDGNEVVGVTHWVTIDIPYDHPSKKKD